MSATSARRLRILETIRLSGAVQVVELAEEHGVSEMTIRRDLNNLTTAGHARRVHGGALLAEAAAPPEGTSHGAPAVSPEWAALARAGASLVFPGMSVAIASGAAALPLATWLTEIPNLRVITNSMAVVDVLHHRGSQGSVVFATGGSPSESGALVGPLCVRTVHDFNTDIAFFAAGGADLRRGITTDSVLESDVAAAFKAGTMRFAVLALASSIGAARLNRVCALSGADVFVTTADVPRGVENELRSHCGAVVTARPTPHQLRRGRTPTT